MVIDDMREKQDRWMDAIKRFGVAGYDDPTYNLLHFTPKKYKYYIGWTEYKGDI